MQDNGIKETIQFDVMEKWTSIVIGGNKYYKDVKVKVVNSTTKIVGTQVYDSLREVFKIVCTDIGLNIPPATPPAMESTIKNRYTGKDLTVI